MSKSKKSLRAERDAAKSRNTELAATAVANDARANELAATNTALAAANADLTAKLAAATAPRPEPPKTHRDVYREMQQTNPYVAQQYLLNHSRHLDAPAEAAAPAPAAPVAPAPPPAAPPPAAPPPPKTYRQLHKELQERSPYEAAAFLLANHHRLDQAVNVG